MTLRKYAKEYWPGLVAMLLSMTAGLGSIYVFRDNLSPDLSGSFLAHLIGGYIVSGVLWALCYLAWRKGAME